MKLLQFSGCFVLLAVYFLTAGAIESSADLYLNLLAVNGTEEKKNKDIEFYLPKELTKEDVLDTAGLELDYDVSQGVHYVKGNVELEPKETKTYKILIRDVWQVNSDDIKDIQEQINKSFTRLKNTQYYEIGEVKKETLLERLDFVVQEQEKFDDDIEARIDRHRIYKKEINDVRDKSLSIKYWRAIPPSVDEAGVFVYIIELENPTDLAISSADKRFYLPREVMPEHIVELQGFDIKYDMVKGQSYLAKNEELKPQEIRRYEIGIVDIWNIDQVEIDNLKARAGQTYKLVEPTEYLETADYLMANIKSNLESIEEAQSLDQDITDHISSYRKNIKNYEVALEDIEALESLLEAVRENLERSKVKNVLKRIRSLKSIAEIAASMFKKPSINKAWKIIIGIIIFVGIYTFLHFTFWGKKSSEAKKRKMNR